MERGNAKSGDVEPKTALIVAPTNFTDATQKVEAKAIPRIAAPATTLIPRLDGIRIPIRLEK